MAGNRIELGGRLVNQPEVRVTPAGTPVIRFIVDCGTPGEELKLGIVMTGDPALAAKEILKPGRQVKVSGRLRALKAGLKRDAAFEVIAESVEQEEGT
ncbi:MAG TPA: single-stranded DNA-binding protein [Candidatus Binataceae bacterium]